MNDHHDVPQPLPPHLSSGNLARVIPVAQQQQVDDVVIVLYSLELYTTGLHAVVRLSWLGGTGGLPHLRWHATDDLGNTYTSFGCGGSGGGRPPEAYSWRLGCTFAPAINPLATHLELTVPTITWSTMRPGTGVDREPKFDRARECPGPWTFTIALT